MENIDKIHKYLIQFMLKNGISTIPRAIKYCSKLDCIEPLNEARLGILVNQINRVISDQYFKIVFATCEVSLKDFMIWINLKNDMLTKQQLNFTERELEYFQVILQEIMHSQQRKIMFVVCLNISSTLTAAFSRENALRVLEKWIEGGYFVRHEEFIHLGPRLILEFTSFLRTHRPECICYLCSEISFTGKICDNCDKIFHSFCIDKYMQSQTACPNCKEEWNETEVFKNIGNLIQASHSEDESQNNDEEMNEPGPSQRSRRRN